MQSKTADIIFKKYNLYAKKEDASVQTEEYGDKLKKDIESQKEYY
jgi:hypothetical protein